MIDIPEEIKQLFRNDCVNKNLRICFPNGERENIVNDNIVKESFKFTESICSREKLKFGLCESSVVEFECVGIKNIKGCEIEVFCEIDISSLPEEQVEEYGTTSEDVGFPYYSLPYGVFVVDSCKRQTDMKRRKVVAYGKIIQENLFLNPLEYAKFKGLINCSYNNSYNFNVYAFLYANIYKEYNSEHFVEIEEETITEIETEYMVFSEDSYSYVTDPTTGKSQPEYVIRIDFYVKRKEIAEDNPDVLYELGYADLTQNDIADITEKNGRFQSERLFFVCSRR